MSTSNPPRPARRGRWWRRIGAVLLVLGIAYAIWFVQPPPPLPPVTGQPMRAWLYTEYGPPSVARLAPASRPVPAAGEVLVRVRAAAVNPLDWHYLRGKPYLMRLAGTGVRWPLDTRMGVDLAGDVVAVGPGVTEFKVGDAVYGGGKGAFAEYSLAGVKRIAPKPASLSYEQAAAIPIAGLTALQGLRDEAHLKAGQKVLINGASGGVGTHAVQIAVAMGAHVTGVASARNAELVRSLGAERFIDYTSEDFTQGSERYDVIYDTVGNRTLSEIRRVLAPHGVLVNIGGGGPDENPWIGRYLTNPLKGMLYTRFTDQTFTTFVADMSAADLAYLATLADTAKVKPAIDKVYDFTELPAAIAHVESGKTRGKVLVRVAGE